MCVEGGREREKEYHTKKVEGGRERDKEGEREERGEIQIY